ncbi:ABC transporter ATP-binding protein [Angustibacter sp. Root456]|uniref:ABC transporter ATP-binding protein n=1 Tax=Angustibacter sp. Root456 TaxID=1736539 RepID=UPI0006F902CF|nr:ABC transporter ATP-binding protein [Angustibacter sp. Root456]KQX66658.1 ABC transporter permease [Angustibacter sp. Root456]
MQTSLTTRPYTLRRGLFVLGQGIRQAPGIFTLAVVGSALYGVMTAGTAWALGKVTRDVISPSLRSGTLDGGRLAGGAGLMAAVALLLTVGVILRRVAAGVTVYDLGALYRRRVTAQYLRLPLSWHGRHPTGQLLSNANADVEATWQVFAPLPMAIGVVVMLVVAAVSMVLADPVLALIGFCVFPLVFVVNVVFQRFMSPRVTRAQQLRAEVSDVAHESFDGALVVKAMGREAAETERFTVVTRRLRDANIAVGRTRGVFDPVIEAIPNLGTLAVLAVGTMRASSGSASAATVVQVAYLFSLLGFPVRALGWVLGELPRSVVGWDRVQSVLDAEGGLAYGDAYPEVPGPAGLSLRQVDYAHIDLDGQPVPVLHDVSLDVEPGSTVAVVGATGAGKSTLASLLVRLADPDRGVVSLDGTDVRELAEGAVASSVALVPQQTFLFDDSVRGNITLGDPALEDADDRRVWAALRLAQADGFVAALPHGLDTHVGERGATLSGGQRQRIALARALVRRPRLLVLDDATSAVDPRVEAAILAGLREASDGTTVVVVAYRKGTIALADSVLFVSQGRVVDRGPHAELTRRNAAYRNLVEAYEREAAERELVDADEEASA